jgi:predicted TIM-barrel fold metal-dependent hydrolase
MRGPAGARPHRVRHARRLLAGIAGEIPDLRLILGHCTFIDVPRAVAVLASYSNVYFETSVVRAYDLFAVLDAIDPPG